MVGLVLSQTTKAVLKFNILFSFQCVQCWVVLVALLLEASHCDNARIFSRSGLIYFIFCISQTHLKNEFIFRKNITRINYIVF